MPVYAPSIFQPVERIYGLAAPRQMEKRFVNFLDFVFSSPLAMKTTQVRYVGNVFHRVPEYSQMIEDDPSMPSAIPLWHQALKVAAFALLIFYSPSIGLAVLCAGFAAKAFCRFSRETFISNSPEAPAPIQGPRLLPEPPLKKWLQHWQAHIAFYLYLTGESEFAKPEVDLEPLSDQDTIMVYIDRIGRPYPREFLSKIPYFVATLRWHPGKAIALSNDFDHTRLQRLQSLMQNRNLAAWDEDILEEFDYLCIPLENDELLSRLTWLQEQLKKPVDEISFEGIERYKESPPVVKCTQWSMNLFPAPTLNNPADLEEVKIALLKYIYGSCSNERKYFLINKTIDDYIVQSSIEQSKNLLNDLLELINLDPGIAQYLTILRLPTTNYRLLGSLLEKLPHLRWLQTMIGIPQEIDLDSIKAHENIHVYSNDGWGGEGLREKFPNCDIFEQT